MIEREFLEDISKYKTKIIAGFTTRQLVCFGIALVVCVPLYHILSAYFIKAFCLTICGVIGLPIMTCGFVEIYGMPIEKFMFTILKTMVFTTVSRKYKNDNVYEQFFTEAISDLTYSSKELKKIKKEAKKEKLDKDPAFAPITPSKNKKKKGGL